MPTQMFLFEGILIGLLIGFPFGAVGTLVIQRVLNSGDRAGWITGTASSLADCIYAGVGIFGLSFISEYLLSIGSFIRLTGSVIIIFMGVNSILRKTDDILQKSGHLTDIKMFFSAFLVGISNPTVIMALLFLFSCFDLSAGIDWIGEILLMVGVFAGTFLWWVILISVVRRFRGNAAGHMKTINRILGSILVFFGSAILLVSLWKLR